MRIIIFFIVLNSIYYLSNAQDFHDLKFGIFYKYQYFNTQLTYYTHDNETFSDEMIDQLNHDNDFSIIDQMIGVSCTYEIIENLEVQSGLGLLLSNNNIHMISNDQKTLDHAFVTKNPGYFFNINLNYRYNLIEKLSISIFPELFYGINNAMHSIDANNDLNSYEDKVDNYFLSWGVSLLSQYSFEIFSPIIGAEINSNQTYLTFDSYLIDTFGSKDYFKRDFNLESNMNLNLVLGLNIKITENSNFIIISSIANSILLKTHLTITL